VETATILPCELLVSVFINNTSNDYGSFFELITD
jgi:hypothetical protein